MRAIGLLVAVLLILSSGCASDREVDRLWREGYGFNNPNPERVRNGQPPLNFDGTVYGR